MLSRLWRDICVCDFILSSINIYIQRIQYIYIIENLTCYWQLFFPMLYNLKFMYEEIYCYLLGNTYCIFNDYNEFWFISWKIFSWDNSCSQLKNRVQSLTTFSSEILILLLFQNSIGEVTLTKNDLSMLFFFSFLFLNRLYILYEKGKKYNIIPKSVTSTLFSLFSSDVRFAKEIQFWLLNPMWK